MMTSNNKAAADIELLPGELMRQLVFEDKPAACDPKLPVQQSRIVLPDDSDEDQIEQIDFDPPCPPLPAATQPDVKQQSPTVPLNVGMSQPECAAKQKTLDSATKQKTSAIKQKTQEPTIKQIFKPQTAPGTRRPQPIPVQFTMNSNQPQIINNIPQSVPRQWAVPARKPRQSYNGYYRPVSNPVRHQRRRYVPKRELPSLCYNGCCMDQPSSYYDNYWPADFRQRGSYFTPVRPRTPEYYLYSCRPARIPLIPMIW